MSDTEAPDEVLIRLFCGTLPVKPIVLSTETAIMVIWPSGQTLMLELDGVWKIKHETPTFDENMGDPK